MNLQIVVNHGQSYSQFAVVDSDAPESEQPCVVACFDNRPQAIFRTLPDAIREKYNDTDTRQDNLTDIETEFRHTVEELISSQYYAQSHTAMTVEYLLNLLTCQKEKTMRFHILLDGHVFKSFATKQERDDYYRNQIAAPYCIAPSRFSTRDDV